MTCNRCSDLCVAVAIRSPGELRKAIAVANDNLRDGTLEEISVENLTIGPQPTFSRVAAGAQFGDLLAYRFRCTECSEVFSLTAETYHGSGGAWRPEREGVIREAL